MYIGVDPGRKGALCLLPSSGNPTFLDLDIDELQQKDLVEYLIRRYDDITAVAVEQVRSLPGMSARSNFSFGYNLGQIETILNCAGIAYTRMQPKYWQRVAGISFKSRTPARERKMISAARAQILYPSVSEIYGPRGGLLDGRVDALLIAHALKQITEEE
jgi:hypothetical protein